MYIFTFSKLLQFLKIEHYFVLGPCILGVGLANSIASIINFYILCGPMNMRTENEKGRKNITFRF